MHPNMTKPHSGAAASASMGSVAHGHSQQMAFAAAKRLQMARELSGAAAGPAQGGDFRSHVAAATGLPGVTEPEVHGAIDALTQAKQLSPLQAAALKAHQGHLNGPAGAQTIQKIAGAVKQLRGAHAQQAQQVQRPPMMPQPAAGMPTQGMPTANGGMPAGRGF